MATLMEYKCPCCGGALSFESQIQKMQCPYCDSEFDVQALKELDAQLEQAEEKMEWSDADQQQWQEDESGDIVTFVCQSCGGEIIGDANTAATSCPYCDNPVVVAGRVAGSLKPDLVIPFRLSKDDAIQALSKHLSGKLLLPKVFKSENRIQEIKGLYVPFWLFDADAEGTAEFKATTSTTWSDSHYTYTKTRYFRAHRAGNLAFRAVPADGSTKMADELMESIEPYDLSQAVDFQTAYLAGYLADKYDQDSQTVIPHVNDRIKTSTLQELRDTVTGYHTVDLEQGSITLSNTNTRYALYPVWLLNTQYKGKRYTFAMNGQTGKFVGDLPVSWPKFWLWFIGLSVGLSGILILLAMLFGLI